MIELAGHDYAEIKWMEMLGHPFPYWGPNLGVS